MKNVLAIIGAGTLGQHIAHYAKIDGKFTSIVFFDDIMPAGSKTGNGDVKGGISEIDAYIKSDEIQTVLIGIGYKHMELRKDLYDQFVLSVKFPNIIHPACYIDASTRMGNGNIILPGCIIDKDCTIGNNNFFNPGCIVAHNCIIKDHSFFGPGVRTSGFDRIGSCCFFGTSTSMIDDIAICDNISTGAGAVIANNIYKSGTYIGMPARQIKQ